MRWAQYLSPSVIAQRLLMQSAGADLQRQHRFQSQVQVALAELAGVVGPPVVSRNRLSVEAFDGLSPFTFADVSSGQIARASVGPAAFLLLVSLLIGAAAQGALRREQ